MTSLSSLHERIEKIEDKVDNLPLSMVENSPFLRGINTMMTKFSDDLKEMSGKIGELSEDVALLVQQGAVVNDHLARLNGKVATHVLEIGNLKQWKAWTVGFSAAITILFLPIAFSVVQSTLQ
jgi:chromosome segregation ATPase